MSRLESLLANLPHAYSRDPLPASAITVRLNTGAKFIVNDLRLRTTPTSGTALDISLRDITMIQLASAIAAVSGYTATATGGVGSIKAYTLIEGTYDGSGGSNVVIPYFTSPNHQILAPVAEAFDDLDLAWQEAISQTDLRQADGVWLDRLGLLYGVTRATNEPDLSYARRITLSVIAVKCNGFGITAILSNALGIAASTAGNPPGRFTTTIAINDTSGNPYNTATINTLIDAYKTFGTLNTTVLTTTASESWPMTDTSDELIDAVATGTGEFGGPEWAMRESGL